MPYHKAMSSVIRKRPDFHTLTSSEVLDEFVAMNILDKTAENAVLRSQRAKKPNLALKAKLSVEEEEEEEEEESNPEDTKYAYHEHMARASRQGLASLLFENATPRCWRSFPRSSLPQTYPTLHLRSRSGSPVFDG